LFSAVHEAVEESPEAERRKVIKQMLDMVILLQILETSMETDLMMSSLDPQPTITDKPMKALHSSIKDHPPGFHLHH